MANGRRRPPSKRLGDDAGWRQKLRAHYADLARLMGVADTQALLETAIDVMTGCRRCSATTKAEYVDALLTIKRELLTAEQSPQS